MLGSNRQDLIWIEGASQALKAGEYRRAVELAEQACDYLVHNPVPGDPGVHSVAAEIARQAQRRLNHPNPSRTRRLWWAIDGPWLISLCYSNLGDGSVTNTW